MLLNLLVNSAYAGPAAVVNSIRGNAFLANDTKTKELNVGDHISNGSEILVEGNSQVTISDYYDHRYHLAGATHIKLAGREIELRSGYLWYQSIADNGRFSINTTNAKTDYSKGEAIVSFDPYDGKTQLLVISGTSGFSNLLDQTLSTEVPEGKFSFINEKNNGVPRTPTTVGAKSYKRLIGNFNGVKALDKMMDSRLHTQALAQTKPKPAKRQKKSRSIASLNIPGAQKNAFENAFLAKMKDSKNMATGSKINEPSKADKIIRSISSLGRLSRVEIKIYGRNSEIWQTRTPSSTKLTSSSSCRKDNKSYKETEKSPSRIPASVMEKDTKPGRVIIRRLYQTPESVGGSKTPKVRKKVGRVPASLVPAYIPPPEPKTKVFEKSLKKEYKKQMRHDDDFNRLIKSLKSIKMDYSDRH